MHNKGTMNYSLPIELSHKGPGKGNKLLLVKWEVGKKWEEMWKMETS